MKWITLMFQFADCRAISMGQGQEVHARRMMAHGFSEGGWLLLQNCHLGLDYIVEVMDTITDTEHVHEDFRLWVTTEEHKRFSINFLQVGISSVTLTSKMYVLYNLVCSL